MLPDRYARIQRFLAEHPWAILPAAMELVFEVLDRRIAGERLPAVEIEARVEAARRTNPPAAVPGSIAVIPVYGLMSNRMHVLQNVSSSGTSTEALSLAFAAALADPAVSAIVFDIDSPGGSVFGVQELADQIDAARGRKPVVAVANAMAASAAYWIASQADELVVTPSGEVGSIGVLAMHRDVSKAAETQGLKVSFVTAGRYKAEGNEFSPLDDEARGYLQSRVDGYYDTFVRAVARGRRASLTSVREGFGEGRMVSAGAAVAAGMADREGTLQETIDRLASKQAKAARAANRASAEELDRVRASIAIAGVSG